MSLYQTSSWLNIALSLEKIFRDALPSMPVYRFGLPSEVSEQRALIDDHALFLQIVEGELMRFQDTYCTLWLCEICTPQVKFLPERNYKSIWLQEMALTLQRSLDRGNPGYAHLFPLYDYRALLSDADYTGFLTTGDTTAFDALMTQTPPIVTHTGFVVRAGSVKPTLTVTQNPMYLEWTVVFQHCNPDAYQGMRG
jgi:hypothetical protein